MSGPSGEISFLDYVQETHAMMLYGTDVDTATGINLVGASHNLGSILITDCGNADASPLLATNPYSSNNEYDPDTDLSSAQALVDDLITSTGTIDEQSTWSDMLALANDNVDLLLPSDSDIEAEVAVFAAEAKKQLIQSYNRVSAGFFDINGVVGTAFPAALAQLEASYNNDVNAFRARRLNEARNTHTLAITQSISDMISLMQLKMSSKAVSTSAQRSQSMFKIAAKSDQLRADIALDVDEVMFNLNVLRASGNILSAPQGNPVGPKGPTESQRLLSGIGAAISAGATVAQSSGPVAGIATAIAGLAFNAASLE